MSHFLSLKAKTRPASTMLAALMVSALCGSCSPSKPEATPEASPSSAAATSASAVVELGASEVGRKVPDGDDLESEEAAVIDRLQKESTSGEGNFYPLYRQLLPGRHHHYTSSDLKMKSALQQGYTDEGKLGYVLASKEDSTVPLFHLFGRDDHFYTTSHEEAVTAVDRYQYSYVEIVGFVYQDEVEGTVPVFRHFNNRTHFYTSSAEESESIPDSGWNLEGVAFYLPAP